MLAENAEMNKPVFLRRGKKRFQEWAKGKIIQE